MEELKLFQSPIFGQVRTVVVNGQVMFAATDVARCLGYTNPQKAIRVHCKSAGVNEMDTPTNGGIQKVKFITKGNLVRLVANSELPQAEEVESWIFDEVIPTVLETGGYIVTKQDDTPEEIMARALIVAQETIKRKEKRLKQLEEKNAKLQPKADFADCIMQSEDCISIGEMANILKQNGLFKKGQNALYEWLRWGGYLLSKGARYNLPSQRSMSLGVMKVAEKTQPAKGMVFINRKAVITPYGQRYFINLFSKGKSVGQCTISFTYK